ncbi:signal peptidase II [Microvirga sp. VF16]|nr:signal peptidase II [Microvirga sp. VF16]
MSKSEDTGAPLADAGLTSQPGSPRPRAASRPRASKGSGRARGAQKGLSVAAILGFSTALVTLILDQVTKIYTLFVFDLPVKEPVEFAPFVNLIVVWNRGISYGLFQQNSEIGRWGLIILSILAAIGLSVWIRRTTAKLLAVSLGLIVGGAIGNVIDRLAYGAVFDFIQIHFGSWSWYVFNVADAAIVAGVVGLLYDSFVLEGRRAK